MSANTDPDKETSRLLTKMLADIKLLADMPTDEIIKRYRKFDSLLHVFHAGTTTNSAPNEGVFMDIKPPEHNKAKTTLTVVFSYLLAGLVAVLIIAPLVAIAVFTVTNIK
jgi:hypothetical protein